MKFVLKNLSDDLMLWKLPSRSVMKVQIKGQLLALKQAHPLLKILALGLVICACLAYFLFPLVRSIQSEITLRPGQWAQMENLIRLARTSPDPLGLIEVLDDAELQKIRLMLAARGIKPSVLRLGAENPPRIEIQVADVLFSVVVDVLEELRLTWRIYPERIELASSPTIANVNFSATLSQIAITTDHSAR